MLVQLTRRGVVKTVSRTSARLKSNLTLKPREP